MPYLNLDDNFADHPKVDALSDGAFRLHVAGLLHCAKHLTDGDVERARARRLTPTFKAALINELAESGLWVPNGDTYAIHDYLDWNKSKAWWDDKRAKDAKRKADWRASHAGQNEGGTP
jgi:hypothetical protein